MNPISDRMAILQQPGYRWFVSGYALSRVGDGIQYLATAWLALNLGAGWDSLIWTFTATTLPALVVGPLTSVAVDRADRRRLAIVLDIVQGITVASIAMFYWAGVLQPLLLYALVFTLAALKQVYVPTIRALVHEIVEGERLLEANATTVAASQIATLFGAILGGYLINAYSEAYAMCLNAGSFLFSAAMIARIPTLPARPSHHAGDRGVSEVAARYIRDLVEGFSVLWHHRRAKPLFFGLLSVYATIAFVEITLPMFVKLKLLDSFSFGLIDSGFAVGGFVGAVLIPAAVKRAGASSIMAGGVILLGAAIAAFPWGPSVPFYFLAYVAIGLAFQIWVVFMTNMQLALGPAFQARVQAMFGAGTGLLSLMIFQLTGLAIAYLPIATIYLVFAILLSVCAAAAILRWRVAEAVHG